NYNQFNSVFLNTGTGNDTVNLESTNLGVTVTVTLGGGTDTVEVTPSTQDLNVLRGDVTINGGSPADTVTINDQTHANPETYTLITGGVSRTGMGGTVNYTGIANLNLSTAAAGAAVNLESTPSGTLTTVSVVGGNNAVTV